MGFKNDNENFIRIELISNLKKETEVESIVLYQKIKKKTRDRIKKSYNENDNLAFFYNEIYDCLIQYEFEYITSNLFLEKDAEAIFAYIQFSNIQIPNINPINEFYHKYYSHMCENFHPNTLEDFLKEEFCNMLSMDQTQWISNNENSNEIVKCFGKWIFQNNKKEHNSISNTVGYLLLCKIWNYYDAYAKVEKTIILLNTINKEFQSLAEKNTYVNLEKIYDDFKRLKSNLFNTNNIFFPILDSIKQQPLGLVNQKNKFKKNINLSKKLSEDISHKSFEDLFNLMNENEEKLYIDKLNNNLHYKLDNYQIASENEIETINKYNFSEEKEINRKAVLRRMYNY